jgi:hypothetical protein
MTEKGGNHIIGVAFEGDRQIADLWGGEGITGAPTKPPTIAVAELPSPRERGTAGSISMSIEGGSRSKC